jgi:adenylate cyclase
MSRPKSRGRIFRLGQALTLLTLLLVLGTAAFVHVSWSVTARTKATELGEALSLEIVASIRQELNGVLSNAEAAVNSLRTIFFQGVIGPEDEAKREFVFLATLQSQPSLAWVAFGWPDGRFFGAHKLGDEALEMVEVGPIDGQRQTRIDRYKVLPGDIEFQERLFAEGTFNSAEQEWYKKVQNTTDALWCESSDYPTDQRDGVGISRRLEVYGDYLGVLHANIDFSRLARYLKALPVGRGGVAFVLAPDGRVIAAPDDMAAAAPEQKAYRAARQMWEQHPLLPAVRQGIASSGLDLMVLNSTWNGHGQIGDVGYFVSLSPLDFQGWVVATVLPEEELLGDLERSTRQLALLMLAAAGAIALLVILAVNRAIARPMEQLAGQLSRIEELRLEEIRPIPSQLYEIRRVAQAVERLGHGLAAFACFIPVELVRRLVAQGGGAHPHMSRAPLTLMFTDVAGFTGLSERLGEAVVPALTRHLSDMSGLIARAGGTIDKYNGDSIMAFWGAPTPEADHAFAACRAALLCHARAREQAAELAAEGLPPLTMRIGLNSGDTLVGILGSPDRLNYTAIGDAVNVAARLESLNKFYGTDILIGGDTVALTGGTGPDGRLIVRLVDRVAVYGRAGTVEIFELLGLAGTLPPPPWIGLYEAALSAYRQRDWQAARAGFEAVIAARNGQDGPSQRMLLRLTQFIEMPPADDWAGVTIFGEK